MSRLSPGQRVGVVTILFIVSGIVVANLWRAWSSGSSGITLREVGPQVPATRQSVSPPTATAETAIHATAADPPDLTAPTASELVVHVVGAVRRPGVYRLPPGARNDDAVRAAGGPTPEANTVAINLASRVEDGTQLYIPTRKAHPEDHAAGDASTATSPSSAQIAMTTSTTAAPGKKSARHAGSSGRHAGNGKGEKLTSPGEGQVDLNAATAQELQRIPGVGPGMAERLIAYRHQSGGFHSVEDLLQVSGIGEKKYAKIQPYVKVR